MVLLIVLLGNWEHWLNRVQEYNYPPDYKPEYSSILVPNVDNVRTSFLMETIAKQSKVRALVCLPQYTSGRLDHLDFKEISLLFALSFGQISQLLNFIHFSDGNWTKA